MPLTLKTITQIGFYWNRLNENCEWTVVYVSRVSNNPEKPQYNEFRIEGEMKIVSTGLKMSNAKRGIFIGPIVTPTNVSV